MEAVGGYSIDESCRPKPKETTVRSFRFFVGLPRQGGAGGGGRRGGGGGGGIEREECVLDPVK